MPGFRRLEKHEAKQALTDLVDRYRRVCSSIASPASDFTETDTRSQFVDPFLRILGWDVENEDGRTSGSIEVARERVRANNGQNPGRPDYLCRVEGVDKMPVEAKKASVSLEGNAAAARQARSYGWTLSLPISVLSNFGETLIFDTRKLPDGEPGADYGVIRRWNFESYLSDFDNLWDCLSYATVSSDKFSLLYGKARQYRGESEFDATFLASFRGWRRALASAIHRLNAELGEAEVGRRVQKILNALLFIRVCEDRNILEYQELLESANSHRIVQAFKVKDRVFNAGIFRALDGLQVDHDALVSVISEMYWPSSKFAFGLLRADTLAFIYEQYLSERVVFEDGAVALRPKPEVVHAGGIARTPVEIVNRLVVPAIIEQRDAGIDQPTVLDMATGSGIFLLSALRESIAVEERSKGRPLEIEERAILAKSRLFGIDIDGAAIEVARLSILMEVLGEEHLDIVTAQGILPDLDKNLVVGNSVIESDFDAIAPGWARDIDVRSETSPLDLRAAFSECYPSNGFDIITGNPPYSSIQTLSEYFPAQLSYFQDERSGYACARSGSFDLYQVFIERGINLLAATGSMSLIIPNRFLSTAPSAPIRLLLADRIERLVHFGEEQVFDGRSTYTSLIFVGEKTSKPLIVSRVKNLSAWYEDIRAAEEFTISRSDLGAAPWQIASDSQMKLFNKMRSAGNCPLSREADVFVGVQSSADDIFFLSNVRQSSHNPDIAEFEDVNDGVQRIERGILRGCLKDVKIDLLDGQPTPDRWAIFPYEIELTSRGRRRARLLTREELSTRFPLALAYLDKHRSALEKRSISPDPGEKFWAYGRSQSLTKLEDPKIVVRVLSVSPSYAVDSTGLVIPGGGDGGPYYLIRPKAESGYGLEVLQAVLSHPAVDLLVTVTGKSYRGSYAVHRKSFLVDLPLPRLSKEDRDSIAVAVRECQGLAVQLRTATDARRIQSMKDRRLALYREINGRISQAYGLTREMIDEAGA